MPRVMHIISRRGYLLLGPLHFVTYFSRACTLCCALVPASCARYICTFFQFSCSRAPPRCPVIFLVLRFQSRIYNRVELLPLSNFWAPYYLRISFSPVIYVPSLCDRNSLSFTSLHSSPRSLVTHQ